MAAAGSEYHVSPSGKDASPGTRREPFATLARAQRAVRDDPDRGKKPITVVISQGTYYLDATLVFTPDDSGSAKAPVTYTAAANADVVISGGMKLDLDWRPYRDHILEARTPAGIEIDQLFVNGLRRHMARYPNYDPDARPYNGAAADAFAPSRARTWEDPRGGYIHAMHRSHWGGYHYRITGKKDNNEVTYEGGWQNNRQMGMHRKHRFVENIFEELDAPGEWYHDGKERTLYYFPDEGVDAGAATFEVVRLRHLIEIRGSRPKPVRYLNIVGLTFRHAARTFMETKEPLLRSDWTIYRGGAVLVNGAEDCAIAECEFDQVGGNSVFVNNYNRRITITGCHIHGGGASGVCFVGNPDAVRNPKFEYGQRNSYGRIDLTPGPKTDDYPADCLVDDCLIHTMSVVEKQATGVQISMSRGITVRHCSIYDLGRAGINISEGTFGGHVIEFCDVFDTVRETGDHGSFNSWGRDRFWRLNGAPDDELPELSGLDTETTVIRNSRWRCDHGWDVDLDDGSSHYEIYNNLFLRGGLKLREGFYRKVYNNIAVNNSLHPHVWYPKSMDVVTGNIWMGPYRPARMPGTWGKEVDRNLFTRAEDRDKFRSKGCDANSLVGDPLFVDPASGDYRVKDGSPALKVGFKNFPMDQFGVRTPALKELARTPVLPAVRGSSPAREAVVASSYWQGTMVRALSGEEFSAFGVSKEEGGVHLIAVPAGSLAAQAGLQTGDVVQAVNGASVGTVERLLRTTDAAEGRPLAITYVRAQDAREAVMARYVYVVTETSDREFDRLGVLPADDVAPIRRLTTTPRTVNEPVATLTDGKLAKNYGPVFRNGVTDGICRADLGSATPVAEIRTWSFNMRGNRGRQNFVLFAAPESGTLSPITTVSTGKSADFTATGVRMSDGSALGTFRIIEWRVRPVSKSNENTALQELQVVAWRRERP